MLYSTPLKRILSLKFASLYSSAQYNHIPELLTKFPYSRISQPSQFSHFSQVTPTPRFYLSFWSSDSRGHSSTNVTLASRQVASLVAGHGYCNDVHLLMDSSASKYRFAVYFLFSHHPKLTCTNIASLISLPLFYVDHTRQRFPLPITHGHDFYADPDTTTS